MKKISQIEKNAILEMHSKLKKPLISEQVVGDTKSKLSKMLDDGCVKNGKIVEMESKNPVLQFAIRQESTKTPGKFRYFFADNRVGSFDGNGKFEFSPSKWSCTAVQQQKLSDKEKVEKEKEAQLATDAKTKKEAYLLRFTGSPYNYLFNVEDIDKQKFIELDPVNDLRVPAGVFAVTDKFYSDPSVNKDIKGSSDSTLNDVLDNQSIDRNACRKNVEDYFKSFKRRNSIVIDGPTFNKAKRIVQSCKDEHYGKWGVLGGGNKLDEILDTMSGGSGGPLSYGEDAKWRLK
jgi:hypothetical protein